LKLKFRSFRRSILEPWRAVDAHNRELIRLETWRICGQVVADSYHFDEERDSDLDLHLNEKLDPDPDPLK
jgi:hypothetical protein